MLPFLRSAGYESHILFEPATGDPEPDLPDLVATAKTKGIRLVYFQKVRGRRVLAIAKALSNAGVRVVYGVCDFVDDEMAAAVDATIVVTDFLKSLYRQDLHAKIHIVHDGIERPDVRKTQWRNDRGSVENPLRAVLVTSLPLDDLPMIPDVPPFLEVEVIGRYPAQSNLPARFNWVRWTLAAKGSTMEKWNFLRFLANRRIKRVQWNSETVYERMAAADVGIVPVELVDDPVPGAQISWWQVKSENRLTMKMSVGLPVVAGPVPSYFPVIDQGKNGYIAATSKEWLRYLEQLRDPDLRKHVGEAARTAVIDRFSKESQAAKMIAVIDGLLRDSRAAPVQHGSSAVS